MNLGFPHGTAEFLQAFSRDARLRWSAEDLEAQQRFAAQHLPVDGWVDWSGEAMALELVQAALFATPLSDVSESRAIWIAGPIGELAACDTLFQMARSRLETGGVLAGIIPCLRDNSPESTVFGQEIARHFRPYPMAEELLEMLRESGFIVGPETAFHRIPSFNHAVLADKLSVKGFRRVFDELERLGYDPIEVGWGEIRFVAASG